MEFACEHIDIDYLALAAIFGTSALIDEGKSYQEPYEAQYSLVDVNKNKLELNISVYDPYTSIWFGRPVKENERKYGLQNQAYFPLYKIHIDQTKQVACDVKNKIITIIQKNNSILLKIYFEPFTHIRVKTAGGE